MTRLARMSQGICLNFKQRDKDQRGLAEAAPVDGAWKLGENLILGIAELKIRHSAMLVAGGHL